MFYKNKKMIFVVALIISAITMFVYLPSLNNEFVNWDDDIFVLDNPDIRSLDLQFIKWSFTTFHTADWFPITWISHAIDYALWELNPVGHHLTNILLHGLNTFIVIILITCLVHIAQTYPSGAQTNSNNSEYPHYRNDESANLIHNTPIIAGAVTGMLFGLHPIHVESVAWVSERKDVLYSFFFLMSIVSYLQYTASKITFQKKKYYAITLLFFILSFMSKSMAVTLPIALIIIDLYPLERINFRNMFTSHRSILLEKVPFLLLSFVFSIVTIVANQADGATAEIKFQHLGYQVLVSFKAICFYLYKMLLPTDLAPFYPYPTEISLFTFEFAGSVIVVLGITVYCLLKWKKQKVWFALWSYFLLTLLPVIGLIRNGNQSAADRYTYLSSLGPFLLSGLGIALIAKKTVLKNNDARFKIVCIFAAFILAVSVLLSHLTIQQVHTWKDSLTLWSREVQLYPNSNIAYFKIGEAYKERGLIQDAIQQFEISVKLEPNWERSHYNLGKAYQDQGLIEKAIQQYEIAIQLQPDYTEVHNNLGIAYQSQGLLDKAIAHYQVSIRLNPLSSNAYNNLGSAYMLKGLIDQGIQNFRIALRLNPVNSKVLQNLRRATAIKSYSGNQKKK